MRVVVERDMSYFVVIIATCGREDCYLVNDLTLAEGRYFKAFAAITNQDWVKADDGAFVRLTGAFLYRVSTDNVTLAKGEVSNNDALRLQSSDDASCGPPIVIEGLFRTIN
jgi:hypothetical protein